jgi:flagellar basal-body rod protein FlgB
MKIIALSLLAFLIFHHPALARNTFDDFYNKMQYLAERDKVLSRNIANADTPNYKPHDLQNKSKRDSGDVTIAKTHSMHMSLDEESQFELVSADFDEIKPNGNAVSLETELAKKSSNATDLQEIATLYNKARGMLKSAITSNK